MVKGRGGLPYVLPFEIMIQVEPNLNPKSQPNPKSSNVLKPSSPQSSKIGMQGNGEARHTIEQIMTQMIRRWRAHNHRASKQA
jgi:hypothetical protein